MPEQKNQKTKQNENNNNNNKIRSLGLERWLRLPTAVLEDPESVPSAHMAVHRYPLLLSEGTRHHTVHTQRYK